MTSARARLIGTTMVVAVALTIPGAASAANGGPANIKVWEEQTIPARDIGLSVPTDISYQPNPRRLVVQGKKDGDNVLRKSTMLGRRTGFRALPSNTIGTTYDPTSRELVVAQQVAAPPAFSTAGRGTVLKLTASNGDSTPAAGRLVDIDTDRLRDVIIAPDGKVYAMRGRDIVLLTRGKGQINGGIKQVMRIKGQVGADADALVMGPGGQRFWVLDREGRRLYRLTSGGGADRVIKLSTAGIKSPRSAVWAPSADPTDPRSEQSLYVADAGQWRRGNLVSASIKELTTIAPVNAASLRPAAGPGTISLIQAIDTSSWSKPSPDPMGLAWAGAIDRYTLVDSEIIEGHPVFAGINVWNFSPAKPPGVFGQTDTSDWDTEPVGIAFDGNVGRYFVANDSRQRVWQIKAGVDGDYWTADDIRDLFSVSSFAADPEGLAFGDGKLFVADGSAKEVYVVDPLDGNFFNGYDVSSYDVESLGIRDAEGIAYAGDRSSLFVVSRKGNVMIEVEPTSGQLISTYALNGLGASNPSGLAYGQRSTDGSQKSIYISARGVDNNSDPNENDGKIYEVSVTNEAPTVNLKNGSFEQDADGDGAPDVWSENSRFTRSTDDPQVGSFVGKHVGADNNHTIRQDVAGIIPGQTYRFSGDINAMTGSDSYTFKVRIVWRNDQNQKISSQTIKQYKNEPSAGWESFSDDRVAPAGAAIARIMMVVKDLNGTILVDDWNFELAP